MSYVFIYEIKWGLPARSTMINDLSTQQQHQLTDLDIQESGNTK